MQLLRQATKLGLPLFAPLNRRSQLSRYPAQVLVALLLQASAVMLMHTTPL